MNSRNSQILRLALPSIVSNITVPLLGLVDLTIVGHMGDVAYIGAIAVIGTLLPYTDPSNSVAAHCVSVAYTMGYALDYAPFGAGNSPCSHLF